MTYGRRRSDTRVLALCGGMVIAGGAERMLFEVLRGLRDRGVTVHCVVNNWASDPIRAMADAIGASWSTSTYAVRLERRTANPISYGRQLLDIAQTTRDLLRTARAVKPTHVLVPDHDTVLRHFVALLALRAVGVRCVMKLSNAPAQTPFYRRLWRWVVNPAVAEFVCNSKFTEGALTALGVPAAKSAMIYETLPRRVAQRELAPRDPRRIIFVGQIIPDKGLHVLLDAVGELVARGRDVVLDVAGDIDGWISPAYGDYRDRIRARAAAPDLASRVRFLGWRDDVPELMAEAAVHCCPSLPAIRESFGLVVLEAKSAGTPSVVFPCGALVEQVTHESDGYVCESISAAGLADGIEHLIADPARLAAASDAARRSAARFDRAAFARAWLARLIPVDGRRATAPAARAIAGGTRLQ